MVRNIFHISRMMLAALCGVLISVSFSADAWAQARTAAFKVRATDWARVENNRYGFALSYPGSVFAARAGPAHEDGSVLISHDGTARLGVAAFENEDGWTLEDYRRHLLATNYDGARIEFAPIRRSWFIISGTRGNTHFYERVSFTCRGRFINTWALLYPVAERPFYDRVVEAVARSYTPGEGLNGRCD